MQESVKVSVSFKKISCCISKLKKCYYNKETKLSNNVNCSQDIISYRNVSNAIFTTITINIISPRSKMDK